MDFIPFYLSGKGKNIITLDDINDFIKKNPELKSFFNENPIELKLLSISPFESFCSWIIGQQISIIAAESILNRFKDAIKPLTPTNLLKYDAEFLKKLGLSKSKANYVRNVATFFKQNKEEIKEIYKNPKYSTEDLINFYTQIKGIGPWTVEMHAIFVEGRKDILSVKDLVVRKGMKAMYNLDEIPTEKLAKQLGKKWGEKATIGTLLAWKLAEEK